MVQSSLLAMHSPFPTSPFTRQASTGASAKARRVPSLPHPHFPFLVVAAAGELEIDRNCCDGTGGQVGGGSRAAADDRGLAAAAAALPANDLALTEGPHGA